MGYGSINKKINHAAKQPFSRAPVTDKEPRTCSAESGRIGDRVELMYADYAFYQPRIELRPVPLEKRAHFQGQLRRAYGRRTGIVAIGSGGPYALAAARALVRNTDFNARQIAEEAMRVAGEICIYSNLNLVIEEL